MLLLRYKNLMDRLKRFEKDIFEKWAENVPLQIESNLMKPLLKRCEGSKLITLNFDSELSAILREVHYLRLMHKENIPKSGIAFSEEQEIYRAYILNLEKSVDWYNNVSLLRNLIFIWKKNCEKELIRLLDRICETCSCLWRTRHTSIGYSHE